MPSLYNAFLGSLVADAVAMPVHWYYNNDAMDRDYKELVPYQKPRNPHPDSILWRSSYQPKNKEADILHNQAKYWGQRGVHYHQFLAAGENTLNFKLATELYQQIRDNKEYNADNWLERYVECMRTPGWHNDTYAEEYHRAFFNRRAAGYPLRSCGIDDIHIGGLATVPALVAGLSEVEELDASRWLEVVEEHVALTHPSAHTLNAAKALTKLLILIHQGNELREVLENNGLPYVKQSQLKANAQFRDRTIVGRKYSPACYLPESFAASLHFCWKYAHDFESGVFANARCGGDSCHRGAVVGSLLAAANPVPDVWLNGLVARQKLESGALTTG